MKTKPLVVYAVGNDEGHAQAITFVGRARMIEESARLTVEHASDHLYRVTITAKRVRERKARKAGGK